MLDVSNEFLQALKNKAAQDIRLEFADGSVIGKADIAATAGGLTYTEILNGDTDMTFGRAVMSELSAVLVNAGGQFTDFDFTQEFTAKFGVKLNGEYVYINLGVFRGERPEKVRGKLIEFQAYDRTTLFERSAEAFLAALTFPATLGEIFVQLCGYCGAEYVSSEFINSGKIIDVSPFTETDYTCREVLAWIAEAAGSYARMSRDGRVELVWFSTVDYTVTRKDRFEMAESEFETPPVDRLEVYNSYGDQLNTSGTGDVVYGITDNPFLYIENDTQLEGLQPYADTIYNRIITLPAYQPSSFRAECNPAVQCGDIITVVDDYDTAIAFPVFMQTITWTGYGKVVYENTGGVTRQNKPVQQRELEQMKKKVSRLTTDLYTSIDSYLNSQEGIASITQAVGGTFVTKEEAADLITTSELDARIESYINGEEGIASITESLTGTFVLEDELEDYATKTEVSTSITQSISQFSASLKLSASVNGNSSTITLTGNGISAVSATMEFSGFVTYTDLANEGKTTINGANITTGQISADRIDTTTLRVQNVYYYEDPSYYSILSSELSGSTTYVHVGAKDIDNDYAQLLVLYGTQIYLSRNGYTPADDTHAIMIDMDASEIVPADADRWYIGTDANPFNRMYLDTGLYLYDSDAADWTRLYIYNGSLTWRDVAGDRHTIV